MTLLNSTLAPVSPIENLDKGLASDEERTLPSDLDWRQERIRGLDVRGVELEDSEFLTNTTYRPSLLLHRLDAKFNLSTSGLDCHCVISAGFPEFSNGQNPESEVELRIRTIQFEDSRKGLDMNEAKQKILKEMESEQIETFRRLANVPATL